MEYFWDKVFPALLQAVVTFVALYLGARFTRLAAEKADERKATREDAVEKRREQRAALQKLLDEQIAVQAAFVAAAAKWLGKPKGDFAEQREDQAAAYADGLTLAPRVRLAFANDDFAKQLAGVVQGLPAMRHTHEDHYAAEQLCTYFEQAMKECIEKTLQALEREVPKAAPTPVSPVVVDDLVKELRLRDVLAQRGGSPAQVERAVTQLRRMLRTKRAGAASPVDDEPLPSDEAPPNEGSPSSFRES